MAQTLHGEDGRTGSAERASNREETKWSQLTPNRGIVS